jgi:hypothetical protein
LYEEQFDLAIPAALQALRFSMDIHGKDSVELVPSYLLLGEASIGLKQLNQAEDYLSMAKWAVLKSTDCDYAIRAQLCRNFGLLYASQANFEGALEQLSEDVSLNHGYRFGHDISCLDLLPLFTPWTRKCGGGRRIFSTGQDF